jgi:hypothetical protein
MAACPVAAATSKDRVYCGLRTRPHLKMRSQGHRYQDYTTVTSVYATRNQKLTNPRGESRKLWNVG